MPSNENSALVEAKVPLLNSNNQSLGAHHDNGGIIITDDQHLHHDDADDSNNQTVSERIWMESKKLWHIVGPAIFSRITSFMIFVITQAFAGHLGDLELAAFSISSNIIVGLDFGLLVVLHDQPA
ncbi:hypothetical protein PIB30_082324 [Stylosanthes scabra]|uniref:Uncharacterized protein n=1 Tax=Stylosanthes scabra TaxID=79078 RepID=A0ABU6QST8_9FABA|nr:hypothetical protein [Stylosanthes scabra]